MLPAQEAPPWPELEACGQALARGAYRRPRGQGAHTLPSVLTAWLRLQRGYSQGPKPPRLLQICTQRGVRNSGFPRRRSAPPLAAWARAVPQLPPPCLLQLPRGRS